MKSRILRSPMLIGLALFALAAGSRADPMTYSAKEIRGQVVDDVSGQPIEGAIVVAQWELVREVIPGLINKSYGDVLKIVEVVSDRDGNYVIPAWGPVLRPTLFHLENLDPSLAFFKPDYYPRYVANEVRTEYSRDPVRISQWDGKTVRLRKFTGEPQEWDEQDGRFKSHLKVDGTLEEYASQLQSLQLHLQWRRETDDWKQFPRMIAALEREADRLDAAHLKSGYRIMRANQLHGRHEKVNRPVKVQVVPARSEAIQVVPVAK